ncbi:MAG: MFS transporter [Paenibacillaceae bacterium]
MKSRKADLIFVISSILLILAVIGFTGGLNIASFKKNYTDSLVNTYAVSGGETVRKIEYAVKYGKPLTNFYGIDDLLSKKHGDHPDLTEVQIVLPDGKVLYTKSGTEGKVSLDPSVIDQVNFNDNSNPFVSVKSAGDYHVFLPLHDRDQSWIGSLDLVFSEQSVNDKTSIYFGELILYLTILSICSLLCLVVYIFFVPVLDSTGQVRKKAMFAGLIIILSLVQIIFGLLNFQLFEKAYQDVAKENISQTAQMIQNDIESVVNKGVPYDKLFGIEDYLKNISHSVPFIDSITVSSSDTSTVYTTVNDHTTYKLKSADEWNIIRPMPKDRNSHIGTIHIKLSESYIAGKIKQIILDMATVWVTSFIFMVEITLFVLFILRRQLTNIPSEADDHDDDQSSTGIDSVRPLSFLLFTAIFMSTSFIPIVMKDLYEPFWGLSMNMIIGLPISVEMLCAGMATLLAGYLMEQIGWKPVFLFGLVLFSLGCLLSGLANDAVLFIGARGLTGLGYGFSLMSLRGYVNTATNEKQRTSGLSGLFSGLYAGVNCGVIVGAMLADRIGFTQVFFTALTIVIGVGIISIFFSKNVIQISMRRSVHRLTRLKPSILRFLGNYKVLTFLGLIIIPTVICSMFLDYYFPVYANERGISTSDVGRAFLMHGLLIVYLGPWLSGWTSKVLGVGKSLMLYSIIITTAMIIFASQGTLVAAFTAIVLLGLADSFGLVAQNNYYVELQATKTIGTGKALGYYDNARKLAQMMGPLVFGSVILFEPEFIGIGFVGIVVLLALFVFIITNSRSVKKAL